MTMEATNSEFLWLFEPFDLLPEYGLQYCLFHAWSWSSVNCSLHTDQLSLYL